MIKLVFDRLAELASHAIEGDSGRVIARHKTTGEIHVLARYGVLRQQPRVTEKDFMTGENEDFIATNDVSNDPRFANHPITKMLPPVTSLVVANISNRAMTDGRYAVYLSVFNPSPLYFEKGETALRFAHVVEFARELLSDIPADELGIPFHAATPKMTAKLATSGGFAEASMTEHADPTSRFLFDTLIKHQTLHDRKEASYVALRSWSKSIKKFQLEALVALKLSPLEKFVDEVAAEMSEKARALFGSFNIKSVVPIPGGSSGLTTSFSERIAEKIARNLHAECVIALKQPAAATSGRSHPKKSIKLQPYEIIKFPAGPVLLIDDVATSGRHIELAQLALRNSGVTCYAMTWIGP